MSDDNPALDLTERVVNSISTLGEAVSRLDGRLQSLGDFTGANAINVVGALEDLNARVAKLEIITSEIARKLASGDDGVTMH
jgi:hypothetical protein